MKYRITKDQPEGFLVEYKDDDSNWEYFMRYCGGPRGSCEASFKTLEQAKKAIKHHKNRSKIVWEE